MHKFKKYQHLEILGHPKTGGILEGVCYIFPKIDGSNASIWMEDNTLKFGSRNRELSLEKDHSDFLLKFSSDERLKQFFNKYPNLKIYGEYLIPHTITSYRDDSWNKFYIFDVVDERDTYLSYNSYLPIITEFNLDIVPPICFVKNPTKEFLISLLEKNEFLLKDEVLLQGFRGEGVVIKNYKNVEYSGPWAKLVRSDFKDSNKLKEVQEFILKQSVEEKIILKYLKEEFVLKEMKKISSGTLDKTQIDRLFSTVYHAFISDYLWKIIKDFKSPTIDFRSLYKLIVNEIKRVL